MTPDAVRPETAVREFLEAHKVGPETEVHLAVSGGLDSMALLHVARLVHPRLHVLHVDHGLRAEASEERNFVTSVCLELGLPCSIHIAKDLREKAAERGDGLEATGRAERYGWFGEVVGQGGVVLTGHHRNDQRETQLLHWLRGSKASAWSGMEAWSTERGYAVGRPFLDVAKADLKAWMEDHGHGWREDPSNVDPAFLRNRVRHELLPLLDRLRPGWSAGMERHGLIAQEWQAHAASWLDQLPGPPHVLPLDALREAPSPRLALMAWAEAWNFGPARVEELHRLAAHGVQVGKVCMGPAHQVVRERDALVVTPLHEEGLAFTRTWNPDEETGPGHIHTPWGTLTWSIEDAAHGPVDPSDETAQLALPRLALPLTVRTWAAGDRLEPLGMKGSQKASDILTQRGVAHSHRQGALIVVASDGQPLWLVGHRIDRRAALPAEDQRTGRVLCMTWNPA